MKISAAYNQVLQADLKFVIKEKDRLERENAALKAENQRLNNQVENLLKPMRDKLAEENAVLKAELIDVQCWLRNDRENALARADHMEYLHVQTIDARLRDVNAAIDSARKDQE